MRIVDMHCDTISVLLHKENKNENISLLNNDLSIDLLKMKKGDYLLQNFACFVHRESTPSPELKAMQLIDLYYRLMEENKDIIAPVLKYDDILENEKKHKLSALLTLEEGGVVFDDLAMLRNYYRLGVRMITLTWNFYNGIAYPNVNSSRNNDLLNVTKLPNTKEGLTVFGIKYIQEMEKLGIIIDVSHLSDAGFYDVLKYTTKPFVASHSNARSVCNVARNMSDDMILQLAKRKGVMGINFCGDFLIETKEGYAKSCVKDMVKHIKYIYDLAGIDVIGLGTDFDGIDRNLEIDDASMMPMLVDALFEEGFTQEEVEKICYKNVLRVYKEILK